MPLPKYALTIHVDGYIFYNIIVIIKRGTVYINNFYVVP